MLKMWKRGQRAKKTKHKMPPDINHFHLNLIAFCIFYLLVRAINLTLVMSNTDISVQPLISKNIVWTYFLCSFFLHISTPVNCNYRQLIVNVLEPDIYFETSVVLRPITLPYA